MSEAQEHTNATTDHTQKVGDLKCFPSDTSKQDLPFFLVQKKKGFLSNLLKRSSSSSDAAKSPEGEAPKNKSFMNSAMDNVRQAAAKEVMHVAEHEAMKQVEGAMNNNGTTSDATPDTETTPADVANNATNWAKRMMNSAQQKVQSLQNIGS